MKATIKWQDGVCFIGEADSGHKLTLDGPPDYGGRNLGVRPMEAVLLGTGACTATDVVSILRKARQQVSDCVVKLEAERATDVPKVFTRIHAHFIVSGKNLDPKKVARAIELSAEKYCSATAMLVKTASMTHDFKIIETS
jgi:putative redox protein